MCFSTFDKVYSQNTSQKLLESKIDSLWGVLDVVFNETYDYEKAKKILPTLINLNQELGEVEEQVYCQSLIAYCDYESGKFDQLKLSIDKTFDLAKKYGIEPDSSIIYNDTYYLLGKYYYHKTNYRAASYFYKETLKFPENKEEEFTYRVEDVYSNLGLMSRYIGDYEQAIPFYRLSLKYLNDNNEIALRLLNIGKNQLRLDQVAAAKKSFAKAKSLIFEQQNPKISFLDKLVINYALLYNNLEKPDSALHYLNLVNIDQIEDQHLGDYFFQKSLALKLKGQKSLSKKLEKKAFVYYEKHHSARHPKIAEAFEIKGNLAAKKGRLNQALQFYQEALFALSYDFSSKHDFSKNPRLEEIKAAPLYYKILLNKASAFQQLDQPEEALATYKIASDVLLTMLQKYILLEDSKFYWLKVSKPLYEKAISLSLSINRVELAWEFSQKSRGILLLQEVFDSKAKNVGNVPDSLIQLENALKIAISNLENQKFDTQDSEIKTEKKELDPLIVNKNKELEDLILHLEQNYPNYYQTKYQIPTITSAEVQGWLKKNKGIFFEYFMGSQNCYVFYITTDEIGYHVVDLASGLSERIVDVINYISSVNNNGFLQYCSSANFLYDNLIGVVLNKTSKDYENLYIIPDEILYNVPFSALLTDNKTPPNNRYDQLAYAIKKHNFSYNYATALLIHSPDPKQFQENKKEPFLGIAPSFSQKHLSELFYNSNEVNAIQEIVGGEILVDQQAKLSSFHERLSGYKIVHFATHAIANDSMPQLSKLYFHQDSLSLFEILNLDHNFELAVLSSCETGIGELKKGEGIISLSRAFIHSGCPSIITSLWQLNDQHTESLMLNFYALLKEGKRKDFALCEGQRKYLQNNENAVVLSHPYYWASFIQVGESNPVFNKHRPVLLKFFIGVCILLIPIFLLYKRYFI